MCKHIPLIHNINSTCSPITASAITEWWVSHFFGFFPIQLRSVEACISRLERDELDLKRQKLKVMQQVASRFDVIIAWATQARDEVLETLAAKVQISMHDIRTEKASALVVKETILGIVARASRKTKLGPELLLMKNELQVALLNEDTFDRYKKLGDRSESLTFLKCVADPSTLDLGMLRVCIGQMMDGEETEAREASLPTFHQLATTVSKLEAELKDLSGEYVDCLHCPHTPPVPNGPDVVSVHIKPPKWPFFLFLFFFFFKSPRIYLPNSSPYVSRCQHLS